MHPTTMKLLYFGPACEKAFEQGQILSGFEPSNDTNFERWKPLIEKMGFEPDQDSETWGLSYEETLLENQEGRKAIIGGIQQGETFVIEI